MSPRTPIRRLRSVSILLAFLGLLASALLAMPAHATTSAPKAQPAAAKDLPGLRGDYYTAAGGGQGSTDWVFKDYKATIVDSNVWFDDLTARLKQLTGSSENAAIRWTGNIDVPKTGTYRFNWYGDNGLRLYIDGNAVIDHWINDWNINVPGSTKLTAGRHTIKVEYFQGDGGAFANLSWAPPGQKALSRIPDSAFTLPTGYVPTVTKASVSKDGLTARITFGKKLGSWPGKATSHLSLGFPTKTATIDPQHPNTLVVNLAGTVYRTWSDLTATYDGTGGATYADGSTIGAFYASVTNASTVDMTTKWAKDVDAKNPLPDYPRPQLTRQSWQSLNGTWQFQGVETAADLKTPPASGQKLDDSIVVPYPMESVLSKVHQHYNYSFYRRSFTVPKQWTDGQRVILNFGAVNYRSTIWVNGQQVGGHTGGYLPFSVDITKALKTSGKQEIVVGVTNTGAPQQAQGKQRLDPSGIFYTAASGIWQTVWLEPAPAKRIDQVAFTPKLPNAPSTTGASVGVLATSATSANGQVSVVIRQGNTIVATGHGTTNRSFDVALPNAHLWSPTDPYLYKATVTLDGTKTVPADTVGSYFGERTVGVKLVNGVPKIVLNGNPTFVNATLDQGFWPDGIYTAPTDAALKWDVSETKAMGFNAIRKHIKVEPARWYYHADQLGMMVLQDMPSMNDGYTPTNAQDTAWRRELHQLVETLKPMTSIISWEPYNEGWGMDRNDQANAVNEVKLAAQQVATDDPSRLVDAESGFNCCGSVNFDTGAGNIVDWHTYTGPATPQPDTAHARPAIDGEHGGWGLSIPAHDWNAGFINYAGASTKTELTDKFVATQNTLAAEAKCQLSGGVYTQTTDVEGEINGLWTYDRRVAKMDMARVRAVNLAVIAAGTNAGQC